MNMKKTRKRQHTLLIMVTLILAISFQLSGCSSDPAATPSAEPVAGASAHIYLTEITDTIGARVTGTANEQKIADYMVKNFEKFGFKTEVQPFTYESTDETTKVTTTEKSLNVYAVKPGISTEEIIVGAHMDSKDVGVGADDNGSALAVMLEVAEKLKDVKTPYTIRFIAFGAEETGDNGSAYYVSKMDKAAIDNTLVMINMDSLAVGDDMNVYGGYGKDGLVRDYALKVAREMGLDLKTNMGANPEYPLGSTGDWSDHAPFVTAGMNYVYFEATNWYLGDMDGYTQVDPKYGEEGAIWHTEFDNMKYIEDTFPGRLDEHLKTFTMVLTKILTDYNSGG